MSSGSPTDPDAPAPLTDRLAALVGAAPARGDAIVGPVEERLDAIAAALDQVREQLGSSDEQAPSLLEVVDGQAELRADVQVVAEDVRGLSEMRDDVLAIGEVAAGTSARLTDLEQGLEDLRAELPEMESRLRQAVDDAAVAVASTLVALLSDTDLVEGDPVEGGSAEGGDLDAEDDTDDADDADEELEEDADAEEQAQPDLATGDEVGVHGGERDLALPAEDLAADPLTDQGDPGLLPLGDVPALDVGSAGAAAAAEPARRGIFGRR